MIANKWSSSLKKTKSQLNVKIYANCTLSLEHLSQAFSNGCSTIYGLWRVSVAEAGSFQKILKRAICQNKKIIKNKNNSWSFLQLLGVNLKHLVCSLAERVHLDANNKQRKLSYSSYLYMHFRLSYKRVHLEANNKQRKLSY